MTGKRIERRLSARCRLLRTSAVIACRRRSRQPPRATVPTGRLGGPGPAAPDCAAVLTAQGLAPNSPSHGRHAPGGACLCSVLEQTALDASPYRDAQPLRGCAPRRLPRPAGPAARAGCGPQSWFSTNTNPLPEARAGVAARRPVGVAEHRRLMGLRVAARRGAERRLFEHRVQAAGAAGRWPHEGELGAQPREPRSGRHPWRSQGRRRRVDGQPPWHGRRADFSALSGRSRSATRRLLTPTTRRRRRVRSGLKSVDCARTGQMVSQRREQAAHID